MFGALPLIERPIGRALYTLLSGVLTYAAFPHVFPDLIPALSLLCLLASGILAYGWMKHMESYEALYLPLFLSPGGLAYNWWIVNFHPLILLAGFVLAYSMVSFSLFIVSRLSNFNPGTFVLAFAAMWFFSTDYNFARLDVFLRGDPVWMAPAAIIGTTLYGLVLVLLSALLSESLFGRERPWASLGVVLTALIALFGISHWSVAPAGYYDQTVALIQPNVPSLFGSEADVARKRDQKTRRRLLNLSRERTTPGDLIVWPEGAGPGPLLKFSHDTVQFRATEDNRLHTFHKKLTSGREYLMGAFVRASPPGPSGSYNTAILFDEQGRLQDFYTKRFLMPFGEYIPGERYLGFLRALRRPFNTANNLSGPYNEPIEHQRSGIKFGILICVEEMKTGYRMKQARDGSQVFIALSTDSWTQTEYVHWWRFYRMRARVLETGFPVLRSGLTGISAIIEPDGSSRFIEPYENGVLRGKVPKASPAFYAQYRWWIYGLGLVMLVLPFYARRRLSNNDRPVVFGEGV